MKKQAIILLSALSVAFSAFAVEKNDKPQMVMGVLNTKDPSNRFVEKGSILYQSNPDLKFCWFATNIASSNKVEEFFTSPKRGNFANAISNSDGSKHKIVGTITAKNMQENPTIGKCWHFDKTDPIGIYSLKVTINGVSFPAQQFELRK